MSSDDWLELSHKYDKFQWNEIYNDAQQKLTELSRMKLTGNLDILRQHKMAELRERCDSVTRESSYALRKVLEKEKRDVGRYCKTVPW